MFRCVAFLLWGGVCLAQTPADLFNKPPAGVDEALRARIKAFYQAHVDGKPRQAEKLVAEDTKDFFYNGNKPKYLNFEIQRIDYSEGFTRAKATVLCEQYVMIPGFTDKPMKVPTPSTWKLVDGEWYWYIDPDSLNETPFGKMKAGPGDSSGPRSLPNAQDMNTIFRQVTEGQVKVDTKAVNLKAGETGTVTITNTAQGQMSLALTGALAGVDVKLDRVQLGAGEKATMTLRASAGAKPGVLSLRVEQTNQVIPIQVAIQ